MNRLKALILAFIVSCVCVLSASAVPTFRSSGGGSVTQVTVTVTVTVTFTPTPIPSIAFAAATSTPGNVFTTSGLGSPSAATHDMIACCLQQSTGAGKENPPPGWAYVGAILNWNGGISYLGIATHCVQTTEPATATWSNLNNDRSTSLGCVLLNNTSCGQDVNGPNGAGTTGSTTVNWNAITTASANTMPLYCAAWGASGTPSLTGPAGVTVDVNKAAVNATEAGMFMGHKPQAAATTIAATTGTLSSSQNSGGVVGAIAPIH